VVGDVQGLADYMSDPSQLGAVLHAKHVLEGSMAAGVDPRFGGAFTPIGFYSGAGVLVTTPFGLVAADGRFAIGEYADGEHHGVWFKQWWIAWTTVTITQGFRRTKRFFVYTRDDTGISIEIEFTSALEARVLAEFMQGSAVGQRNSIPIFPARPQLQLPSYR
jgi:hypothetical protein